MAGACSFTSACYSILIDEMYFVRHLNPGFTMKRNRFFTFSLPCLVGLLLAASVSARGQSVVIRKKPAHHTLKPGELSYINAFPFDHFLGFKQPAGGEPGHGKFFHAIATKPGLSFLSSVLIPGLGQAAHHQWIKMGLFAAVEAVTLYTHFHLEHQAANLKIKYQEYADQNWSVVNYATYLVKYHNYYFPDDPIALNSLADPGADLTTGPTYTHQDWSRVDIDKLHQLEDITYYNGTSGVAFSHNMPEYGSQQYYELMSKYFQFAPGWRDFHSSPATVIWDTRGMPTLFNEGAAKADRYNDKFRLARTMITITIINHFASAFDAFITTKLRMRNLHVGANGMGFKAVYEF